MWLHLFFHKLPSAKKYCISLYRKLSWIKPPLSWCCPGRGKEELKPTEAHMTSCIQSWFLVGNELPTQDVPLEWDRDFGELCGSHQGCQVPFRPPINNVGLLLRRCIGKGLHLAKTEEPRGFSRVAAGFSSYDPTQEKEMVLIFTEFKISLERQNRPKN